MEEVAMSKESEKHQTYYDILEVSPKATLQEIHNQYLKAKNAYTLDNPAVYSILPPEECNQMLDKIEEAYFVLSSPRKRREYDIAHGITPENSTFIESSAQGLDQVQRQHELDKEERRRYEINRTSISKRVVENRFKLDYTIDDEMEKKIEQATEFTGSFLKEIREYKNMTIDRMADLTKISKNYLNAIEEENWENLPATAYVRGFVFQYAKMLKLDHDLVCKSFIERAKAARA